VVFARGRAPLLNSYRPELGPSEGFVIRPDTCFGDTDTLNFSFAEDAEPTARGGAARDPLVCTSPESERTWTRPRAGSYDEAGDPGA